MVERERQHAQIAAEAAHQAQGARGPLAPEPIERAVITQLHAEAHGSCTPTPGRGWVPLTAADDGWYEVDVAALQDAPSAGAYTLREVEHDDRRTGFRRAAAEGYRVIGLDAFRNGFRVERAAGAGARCYSLGMGTPINLLDIVYDDDPQRPGRWIIRQTQHVISTLALMLGDPGRNHVGKACLVPRRFTPEERGVLERAIPAMYRRSGATPDTPLPQMPILSDLIAELERLTIAEARAFARQLRMALFGDDDPGCTTPNERGKAFNTHTAIDWDFSRDINYYDLSGVDDDHKALFYVLLIGAVLRWMRNPRLDLSRPTLLQIDEFGYAAQVEAVQQLAVEITKTARKYRVGLMLIDQNPVTFLGDTSGRQIFENAVAIIAFHLEDVAARQLGEAVSALTPEHLRFLRDARKGAYVAIVGQDVYVGSNQLSPREQRFLLGS